MRGPRAIRLGGTGRAAGRFPNAATTSRRRHRSFLDGHDARAPRTKLVVQVQVSVNTAMHNARILSTTTGRPAVPSLRRHLSAHKPGGSAPRLATPRPTPSSPYACTVKFATDGASPFPSRQYCIPASASAPASPQTQAKRSSRHSGTPARRRRPCRTRARGSATPRARTCGWCTGTASRSARTT